MKPVLAYVAGPYRGKSAWEVEGNIRRAEETGLWLARIGITPVIPHTMYRFFDGLLTDEFWLASSLELMSRCDILIMCAGWRHSSGSAAELEEWKKTGKPVFFMGTGVPSVDVLEDWLKVYRENQKRGVR